MSSYKRCFLRQLTFEVRLLVPKLKHGIHSARRNVFSESGVIPDYGELWSTRIMNVTTSEGRQDESPESTVYSPAARVSFEICSIKGGNTSLRGFVNHHHHQHRHPTPETRSVDGSELYRRRAINQASL